MVAEGIESAAVSSELRALGCDIGQGFHLGRPMQAAAFTEWMHHPGRVGPRFDASGYPQADRPTSARPPCGPGGRVQQCAARMLRPVSDASTFALALKSGEARRHGTVPPTQDQHNLVAGRPANTVPARTKRHSPVRSGTACLLRGILVTSGAATSCTQCVRRQTRAHGWLRRCDQGNRRVLHRPDRASAARVTAEPTHRHVPVLSGAWQVQLRGRGS
jgi:hypothetical protein